MAVTALQFTVPSNGSQVVILTQEAANSSQVSLRNTGTNNVLLGPQAFLNPPLNFTATPATGGGTFAANTYYWQITATNSLGETIASLEANAAVALNGHCNLAWTQVTGATGYKIYRSTSSGGEHTSPALVTTIGSGSTVAYNDTGTAVSSGATPATNTAGVAALFPLQPMEYLGMPVLVDDVLVAQVQTPGTAGQITILATG